MKKASGNSFQWLLSSMAFATWKTRLRNLHLVQCLNISPMEKAWFMSLMKKELWLIFYELYGLYFLAPFIFLLLLSTGTRSTLAKIWGA